MNLTGKVALITGASRGIGQAIADTLQQQGVIVIGTATTEHGAKRISERLQAKQGQGIALDVTDHDAMQSAWKTIEKEIGTPSIVVNNAGITRDNLMMRMRPEEWDAVIDTNLSALYRLTRLCLRPMIKQRWGRIINISSVVGATGNPGQANYAAAKAGMIGFSKSLAREVASRHITVNCIAPGFIETDMTATLPEEQKIALLSNIPMQRLGQPQDIADAVAFLSSDAANYITGQTLHINGGMYLS